MVLQTGKPHDGAAQAPSTLSVEAQRRPCLNAALDLLAIRERSAAELRERLRKKGYAGEVIEDVLDRLRRSNVQSDLRFAEQRAGARAARGFSTRQIQRDLRAKGVEAEVAAQAAAESPEQEEARALAVAAQRANRMRTLPAEVAMRRLIGFLARRGFDGHLARTVAATALQRAHSSPQDVEMVPLGSVLDPPLRPDVR